MKDKRITRLVKLLQMLQGGRGQNWDGLAKAFGVGRRTIFRDLETLRLAGVPVEYDARAQRYSIQSGHFGPPSDLTAEEALSIWALANSLNSYRPVPFYESARAASKKLERQLSRSVRKKFRSTTRAIHFLPAEIGVLPVKTAVHQFLIDAIDERRAVEIDYHSLTEWERITTSIFPYRLLFALHSWYVIGRSSMHGEVRTFNLVRIESLRRLNRRFKIPKSFDLTRHFGDAWRMIPSPGPNSRVVVKFRSMVAQNVAEVTWHRTQQTTFMPDGSLIFQATVSGLDEIKWWILRYGDQAEVLRPQKLRRMIAQHVWKMATTYDNTLRELNLVG